MVRGGLLTRYFLEDGIREVDAYRALNPAEVVGAGVNPYLFADVFGQRDVPA